MFYPTEDIATEWHLLGLPYDEIQLLKEKTL